MHEALSFLIELGAVHETLQQLIENHA